MSYSFQPRYVLSLFCLLLIILFSSLGIWQLQRAEQKENAQAELEALAKRPPQKLNFNSEELKPATKASAIGRYKSDDQFLLDNIVHQGKPGYYLLTPFEISGSKEIILVNRGWLAKRSQGFPPLLAPSQEVTIQGTLAAPRSKPVILGGIDHPVSDTPPLWYYMDIEVFEDTAGYKVLPLVLRLDPESNSNFVRDWPQYEAKSGMHIGYAIQWFVFAFFVLIGLVGINIKNKATVHKNKINNNN